MAKTVVLAEKPSVGRDIAKVLKCNQKRNGYLEGDKYIVTWALGHLVTLADPETYNKKYATWNMEDLPMLPKELTPVVIKKTSKQFNAVKSQMLREDVNEIVIATDAGREGELVARWIIDKIGVKKPLKRLWISSVTDKAISEGFKNLKDGKNYENLYHSAVARSEADWVVGINATRALTCKYNAQLSCGRVQSPTLEMIQKKEEEIQKFRPKDYYGVNIDTGKLKFTWQEKGSNNTRTFDKKKAEDIIKKIDGKDGKVVNVDKTFKKTYPPKLYDLTDLQRDANRIFNYSAKETLSIMQKLYERHKILTYPRTDSRHLTADVVDTLKDRLKAVSIDKYSKLATKLLRGDIKANKSFVDDSKVTDHHAIIPTEEIVFLNKLNNDERKIYDLVVKRFLAVLYPPFEYEQTTVKVNIEGETFTARGKIVKSNGWKEVYKDVFNDEKDENEISEQVLPNIEKGDKIEVKSIYETSGKTKPPARFNEGTLLSAMENPTRYMQSESKDLKKIIGETGGIGTVATRADIIDKLFNSFLIEKKGKEITITSKGSQLLDLVPEDLKSPALTAEWEQKLTLIEKGKLNKDVFINEMKDYAKEIVNEIKKSDKEFKHDNMTRNKCPECGKYMLEIKNKRGKMLVCQDRECGVKKGVSKITNARCPRCKKRLELRGEGDNKTFVCNCGHREKLSAFNKRKKKQGNKPSKREVNKYLNKQDKEEDENINTALADALSKLKL